MKIEATARQIRALLQLADLDARSDEPDADARRHGLESVHRVLPRALIERYHALVDAGHAPAIVAIDRGACSGCHVRVPTMIEHQVARSLGLYTCSHCRRMMYAPELLRQPAPPEDAKPRRAVSSTRS